MAISSGHVWMMEVIARPLLNVARAIATWMGGASLQVAAHDHAWRDKTSSRLYLDLQALSLKAAST